MQRRRFLELIGGLARGTALGALALGATHGGRNAVAGVVAAPAGQHPLRPPGALPEPDFRAACTRCYLCGEVCTSRAIRFPSRVRGAQSPLPRGAVLGQAATPTWEGDSTPYVLPWQAGCAACMRCGTACPTGALKPIPPRRAAIKQQVRMGVALIDPKICLPWTRTSWCGACLTICPFRGKAITVDHQGRPTIHSEHCIGCGLCVEICPIKYKAVAVVPPFYPDRGRVRGE